MTKKPGFDLQPTLKGNHLRLRPLEANDLDALYAVASNPNLWNQHPARTRHERPVFEKLFEESMASGGALVAIDLEDDQIIGSSRYNDYDPEDSSIEIGWTFLAESHWGGTYNKDMKHLMITHAYQFVDTVVFLVAPENYRSQKAVSKLGAFRKSDEPIGRGGNLIYLLPKDAYVGLNPSYFF